MDLNKFIVKSVTKDSQKGVQIVGLDNGQFLHLKQNWYNSIIEEGDYIAFRISESNNNQISTKISSQISTKISNPEQPASTSRQSSDEQANQIITIDDLKSNFIILNPDKLVTSTDLSSITFCQRKTWLNSRFKFYGDHNRATLLGSLIHNLFQDTINDQKLTSQFLHNKFSQSIRQPWVLRSLVAINLEEQDLINDSKEYIASIVQFNRKFASNQFVQFDDAQPNLKLKINRITDIEDLILAPAYGLKGKIDVTMDVELNERDIIRKQKFTPFELKTGKVSFSYAHQAQVSLYTIMIDNSTNQCNFGLLAYLKNGINLKCITVNHYIRNGLLMQRNELVHFLKYLKHGPATRTNLSFCSNCEHLLDCCLLAKIYEPEKLNNFETHQPDLITNTLCHLNQDQIDFFEHWINLIYTEEKATSSSLKDSNFFWNKDAYELEKNESRALAKLELEVDLNDEDLPYEFVFRRADAHRTLLGDLPVDLRFSKSNEKITLSIENEGGQLEKVGFLNGIVKYIDKNFVTVRLDEQIREKYFKCIFRLDILPISTNFSFFYTAILRLIDKNEINSERLRKLIIDKEKATFDQQLTPNESELIKESIKHLNVCQQNAVLRSFEMDDYLLIHGFPGCGKTESILSILKILSWMNRTVIITAHTNQAVDHILIKLKENGISFMRIGNLSRIHQELIDCSEDYLVSNCKSTLDIKNLYSSINIFAGTCYAFNSHLIFSLRTIEFCVVDEASQACLPENLMPLLSSRKFILVGDPKQLTPIVVSNQPGLDRTLFELLMNENEDNCVELKIQYRMNEEIMRFANFCTYDNKLTCADDEIANSTLKFADNYQLNEDEIWIDQCLSSDLNLSVIFIDINGQQSDAKLDEREGNIQNQFEVDIIKKIVDHLIIRKVTANEIGLISFYNRQIALLKASIAFKDVEISTIDRYQGKDKDVIIISCVKNGESLEINSNEILHNKRRLNVAMTRARKKLIVIGSQIALVNYEPFKKFFECLNDNQIIKINSIDRKFV